MASQQDKIGALWIKQSRGGAEFMSGEVEVDGVKHRVTVFRNSYKTDANRQPDYHVFKEQPRAEAASQSGDESDGR